VSRHKAKSGKLSVFKGREARLNKAIFHILAHKSPLAIYDIHKEVKAQRGLRRARYANVNKRVRALDESGYVKKIGIKKTKAGFQSSIYELTPRAYLALMLDSTNLEYLLNRMDENDASEILAAIATLT
jgi:hypothetical protein